ncbi:MAG: TetR/AcrR family transcriptional regulator [Henriciella sp.]|jgi:TetR/AcrR family transcriptional repressor of nem operon
MARTRNQQAYADTRERLIEAGLSLFRSRSFDGVGISEVLTKSAAPKGSFYHYFENKEDFGLAVSDAYHARQMEFAKNHLEHSTKPAFERLRDFFGGAMIDYKSRAFADGCLMCNLSTELADQNPKFQARLAGQWSELTGLIADQIDTQCLEQLGLPHLTDAEAADQLVNAWAGALTRMKADGNGGSLQLFMKTYFKQGHS